MVFVKKKQVESEPHNSVAAEIDGLKLVHNPFPPSEIDFDNKKVLIRSSQAKSTKGKMLLLLMNI
jgi:hypothetical protein